MKAVVLHSGGLDSTALIAHAIIDGAEEILGVSIKYGSLHNEAEGQAAKEVIEWFRQNASPRGISFKRVEYQLPGDIFKGEKSALMGEISMPHLTYKQIQQSEGPSPTVVPFRNANLLSIATSIADARGYDMVYIGAHADDHHQWAYPDCTPEFLGSMANAVYVGTYEKVRLAFPFIWMQKNEIVGFCAYRAYAPLHLTWSCYNPKSVNSGEDIYAAEYIHCGECPTCIERANAFAEAGFVDPTVYNVPLDMILGKEANVEELDEWQIW